MNRIRLAAALLLTLLASVAVFAEDAANEKAVEVKPNQVCMVNDRSMAMEQIPVEVDGKTYYGCCPMCKERLAKEESFRYAIDPVSGAKVDKAKAVIGALPGAAVVYFESIANLEKFNAGQRAQKEK